MNIGIDVTLFCLEQPTGVPLMARYLTEALVREFPQDRFILFACVPRMAARSIARLPIMSEPNVQLKLIALPHRLFRLLLPLWQRWQWPPVEWFVGRLDIFHTFDWFTLPAHAVSTATIYDMTPLSHPEWHTPQNKAVFANRFKVITKRCAHLFAISTHTKHEFNSVFPDFSGQLSVVYPDAVIQVDTLPPLSLEKQLADYGLKSGYLLMVGTIEPRKNMVRVLKAYLELEVNQQSLPSLVVVGRVGWDEEALRLRNMSKKIVSVGYVSDKELARWYRGALALIYPSLSEGFGIPIVEAMRSGAMVVTSETSSMPEVGGTAAWYCNPLSIDSIKHAIMQTVTASTRERQRRVKLGLKQAELFSFRRAAIQMRKTWKTLCQ